MEGKKKKRKKEDWFHNSIWREEMEVYGMECIPSYSITFETIQTKEQSFSLFYESKHS